MKYTHVYAAVSSCLVLALLVTTVTFANQSSGEIQACVANANGNTRILTGKLLNAGCKKNETLVVWNKEGVPGQPGEAGPVGPAGPQGEPGVSSWDEARIAALEARIAELEGGEGGSAGGTGEGEELRLSLSTSNPEATDIVVDDSGTTDGLTIMVFDIAAIEGDIELTQLVVRIDTPGETTTNVVDDVELVIDGQTFREEALGTLVNGNSELVGGGEAVWYLFDIDGDVVIGEDDIVTVSVAVDLEAQTNYVAGQTIRAAVGTDEKVYWLAEGFKLLAPQDITGSAIGDTHALVLEDLED